MNRVSLRFISILRHQKLNQYSSVPALARNLSYQSDLSLKNIYPNSSLKLSTPPALPSVTKDGKFSGFIPISDLDITYSRSSGPGGQHVNTVNTKVELRFKVAEASWLSQETRAKFVNEFTNKITKDGFFVLKSDLTRSQQMNLADALEKLRNIIRKLEFEPAKPTEQTLQKLQKRQEKAARERLHIKRQRSQVKSDRQGPSVDF
ncbi:hypothetical protein ACFFRR_003696 [Megaselia abdita]